MRGTARVLAAVALALVGAAACSGDDGDLYVDLGTTTTTVADDDTTTSLERGIADPEPPPQTATSLGTVPDVLPDGTYFGYIVTLIAGDAGATGQFDLAELLTGQAAIDAAQAAGEEPFADFFIKNENPRLRPIVVAPDAEITDIDYHACCASQPTTVTQFIADRDAEGEERTAVALTVSSGRVAAIHEIYFP